jgi:hypothetical protein
MMYETDSGLDQDLQQIGCYAESIAIFNPDITDQEMNEAWEKAKTAGYVNSSGDLIDPQGLVNILGYPLKFRDGHFPPDTPVDPETMHIVAKWFNINNGLSHFVVMDGKGIEKENVAYDPIEGGSLTVREGSFDSYRLFDRV